MPLGIYYLLYETKYPDWVANKNLSHAEFKTPDPDRHLRQESGAKHVADTTSKCKGATRAHISDHNVLDSSDGDITNLEGIANVKSATSEDSEKKRAMHAGLHE